MDNDQLWWSQMFLDVSILICRIFILSQLVTHTHTVLLWQSQWHWRCLTHNSTENNSETDSFALKKCPVYNCHSLLYFIGFVRTSANLSEWTLKTMHTPYDNMLKSLVCLCACALARVAKWFYENVYTSFSPRHVSSLRSFKDAFPLVSSCP